MFPFGLQGWSIGIYASAPTFTWSKRAPAVGASLRDRSLNETRRALFRRLRLPRGREGASPSRGDSLRIACNAFLRRCNGFIVVWLLNLSLSSYGRHTPPKLSKVSDSVRQTADIIRAVPLIVLRAGVITHNAMHDDL